MDRKYRKTGKVVLPYLSIKAKVILWIVVSRGVSLLEHEMKVYEYVLEKRMQYMVFVKVGQLQGQCLF